MLGCHINAWLSHFFKNQSFIKTMDYDHLKVKMEVSYGRVDIVLGRNLPKGNAPVQKCRKLKKIIVKMTPKIRGFDKLLYILLTRQPN